MTGRLPRRGMLAVLGAVGTAALGSCASLPTDSQVRTSDVADIDSGPLVQSAAGPAEGADPVQIVSGFLRACLAGFSDGFSTARSFLLSTAAASWNPWQVVRVYSGTASPVLTRWSDGSVGVETELVGTVGTTGVLTMTAAKTFSASFSLVTDAQGQWRIASLPQGVLASSSGVDTYFDARPLYFLSADRTRLVPELRWLPRLMLLRSLIQAFVSGPSAWLAEGVVTALPAGTVLDGSAVAVNSGVARIRLLSADGQEAQMSAADRSLLAAQIWQCMRGVDGVEGMEVTLDGQALGRAASLHAVDASPGALVAMSGGEVVEGLGRARTTLATAAALGTADARHPTVGADGTVYVVSASSLLRLGAGEAAASAIFSVGEADQAGGLLAPVVDRHGWVWTAASGVLTVVNSDGLSLVVGAAWLKGREVVDFDLSAESERIVVKHRAGVEERVAVAAVVRDEAGAPTGLGAAVELTGAQGGVTRAVVWYDPMTVAVLAADSETAEASDVRLVQVCGMTTSVNGPAGAVEIAADRVSGEISVTDASQQVWQRSRTLWRVAATDLGDVSYRLV